MAIVKYAPLVAPLVNEHAGFTFQSCRQGNVMMLSQKNDRNRGQRQVNRKNLIISCTTAWRNMSPTNKTAWQTFADTYPQRSNANPDVFLTGYQLFVKRNTYLRLNCGIQEPLIVAPLLEEFTIDSFTASISEGTFSIDVSELYILNFGIIPSVGQFLLCRVIPYSTNSGQFFTIYEATLQVLEASSVSLLVSLDLPEILNSVIFSVYLSKPFYQSQNYQGTKVRYMGFLSYVPPVVPIFPVKYGFLYNAWVTSDVRNIAAEGWRVPTSADFETLLEFIDPSATTPILNVGGGILKEAGFIYWNSPNTGAANSVNFYGRGAGQRKSNGIFADTLVFGIWWNSTAYLTAYHLASQLQYNKNYFATTINGLRVFIDKNFGLSIRLIKESTTLVNGETGIYTGNDGKNYRTICIGSQEWMADNLCETKYRNADWVSGFNAGVYTPISAVGWAALASEHLCVMDDDISNL